ncbi:MAG: TIGR00730 family Rossman fold protein [Deltaproteobacteria bacterium]|nr:TIGR00730 family Rossman fold protein [Deltaproteobacteria bacterium]
MKIYFDKDNGPIDEMIKQLMDTVEGIRRPSYIRDMILASLKAGQEDDESANLKVMSTTLKEMRFTSKVFSAYQDVRKVTVFGSARIPPGDPLYETAKQFGEKLAEAGFMLITGGGAGIMRAVNEGAGSEHSFGVNIRLPFDERPNPVIEGNPRFISYKYFFNRKVAFLKESDAVALFPGGFGTLDEAMETLTLLQTGKRNPMPLVLIDNPEGSYWSHLIKFFEMDLLECGYIHPTDVAIFERVSSIDDALKKITHFYHRYHSVRYVRGRLVIRLSTPLSQKEINELNEKFQDILLPNGVIAATDALEEEKDDEDDVYLPRLVVDYNRRYFGRLRNLIDMINDF